MHKYDPGVYLVVTCCNELGQEPKFSVGSSDFRTAAYHNCSFQVFNSEATKMMTAMIQISALKIVKIILGVQV